MHTKITSDQPDTHQMVVPLQEHAETVKEEGGLKSLPVKRTAAAKPIGAGMKSLLVKRTAAAKLIGIGNTLFNELGDPLHRNFDPSFPKPVRRITPKGPLFFKRDDIVAWVASLAADRRSADVAANDAAFESCV